MISDEVHAIEARKSQLPESRLAGSLLASDRPSRADVMCHGERHKLARVYNVGEAGGLVLAVPRRVVLTSFLYADVPEDDTSEMVYVPWLYRLDGTDPQDDVTVHLRCRCHSYWTRPSQIRDQLGRQPRRDRYLMVSISIPARAAQMFAEKQRRHAERWAMED